MVANEKKNQEKKELQLKKWTKNKTKMKQIQKKEFLDRSWIVLGSFLDP
jgi:hypothetical protein